VRAIPGSLSTAGGSSPVWSRDGKHIFYSTADNHIMSVDVAIEPTTVRASAPRELFVAPSQMFSHNGFTVDATGTHFLLSTTKDNESAPGITVVVNWGGVAARSVDASRWRSAFEHLAACPPKRSAQRRVVRRSAPREPQVPDALLHDAERADLSVSITPEDDRADLPAAAGRLGIAR